MSIFVKEFEAEKSAWKRAHGRAAGAAGFASASGTRYSTASAASRATFADWASWSDLHRMNLGHKHRAALWWLVQENRYLREMA